MDELGTIIIVATLVLAVHAIFAIYLYRSLTNTIHRSTLDGQQNPWNDPVESRSIDDHSDAPEDHGTTIRCPVCGVSNDPQFQFCRHCVSELSGQQTHGRQRSPTDSN